MINMNNELPKNPFVERRKRNIERTFTILKTLTSEDGKVEYRKAKSVLMNDMSLREVTIREYLEIFIGNGIIEIKGGYIYIKKT